MPSDNDDELSPSQLDQSLPSSYLLSSHQQPTNYAQSAYGYQSAFQNSGFNKLPNNFLASSASQRNVQAPVGFTNSSVGPSELDYSASENLAASNMTHAGQAFTGTGQPK